VENLVDLHAAEMVQPPRFLASLGMTLSGGGIDKSLSTTPEFVIPSEARNPGFAYTVTAA
jgi:hypothetical protein